MPEPSNPTLSTLPGNAAPSIASRKMPRLNKAGWIIKSLASLFVVAFLCAYLKTYNRYGAPRTPTRASLTHPLTQAFAPTHFRLNHRRRVFLPVRHTKRRPPRSSLYHLATLRRLHRLFSQLLVVRS